MRETGGKSPVISRIYVSGRCKGLLVEFRYEVAASALSHFPRTTRGDTASRLVSTRYLGLHAGTRIVEERIKAIFGVRSVLSASLLVGLDKVPYACGRTRWSYSFEAGSRNRVRYLSRSGKRENGNSQGTLISDISGHERCRIQVVVEIISLILNYFPGYQTAHLFPLLPPSTCSLQSPIQTHHRPFQFLDYPLLKSSHLPFSNTHLPHTHFLVISRHNPLP